MSVLTSYCVATNNTFNKKLFLDIKDNLKIISEEELENSEQQCKEVQFAIYIRTDKDNLVLTSDKGTIALITSAPSFVVDSGAVYPSLLIDSGLMCGKNLIDQVFYADSKVSMERVAMLSTCFPVGAVETEDKYVAIFNIIVSADLLKDPTIHLTDGSHFKPIETLNLTDSLQKEIAKSLVLVERKEEQK